MLIFTDIMMIYVGLYNTITCIMMLPAITELQLIYALFVYV